jgi:hypothetical protein
LRLSYLGDLKTRNNHKSGSPVKHWHGVFMGDDYEKQPQKWEESDTKLLISISKREFRPCRM